MPKGKDAELEKNLKSLLVYLKKIVAGTRKETEN